MQVLNQTLNKNICTSQQFVHKHCSVEYKLFSRSAQTSEIITGKKNAKKLPEWLRSHLSRVWSVGCNILSTPYVGLLKVTSKRVSPKLNRYVRFYPDNSLVNIRGEGVNYARMYVIM